MKIQMTDPKGITLLTAGKKLDENIEVVPGFSTAPETVKVTITDNTSGVGGNWLLSTSNGVESLHPDSETIEKDVIKGSLMIYYPNTNEVDVHGIAEYLVFKAILVGDGEIEMYDLITDGLSSTFEVKGIRAAEDMTILTAYIS